MIGRLILSGATLAVIIGVILPGNLQAETAEEVGRRLAGDSVIFHRDIDRS